MLKDWLPAIVSYMACAAPFQAVLALVQLECGGSMSKFTVDQEGKSVIVTERDGTTHHAILDKVYPHSTNLRVYYDNRYAFYPEDKVELSSSSSVPSE